MSRKQATFEDYRTGTIPCECCRRWFYPPVIGRKPIYCSDRCKQRAYRRRKLWKDVEALAAGFRNTAARPGEKTP